jgi:lipopolysaccharide heptosyltransferase II
MITVLSYIGWFLINAIGKTLRITEINNKDWEKEKVVYAFWHGEQFIPFYVHRNQGAVLMSSLSRDGEIQTGILLRCGYNVVRGSSSKGAERALVETIRMVKKGFSAAFAVDGPRGPIYEVKPGIVYLAQKTGKPMICVSAAAKKFFVFKKAWDKYQLPQPFAKAVIAYSKPFYIAKEDNLEEKTKEIQNTLKQLSAFTHTHYWSNDIPSYLQYHPNPKILIVQPSRIGDVLFTLPAVAAIRKQYPHAWIGWFVDERCAPVIEGSPDIDEVIVFDRTKKSLSYIRKLYRYLRDKKIDLSIDFHGLAKSAFMVLLGGARYRIASSSTNGMRELSWLFSKEIAADKEDHCVERHLAVARYLNAPVGMVEYHVAIHESANKKIDEFFAQYTVAENRPIVAIHPGGGWLSRRWDAERFSALINRMIAELHAQVILVGGKEGGAGERGLNEEIIAAVHGKIIDATGVLGLKELAALLRRCNLFVANEAGPMHLATALGIPAIALLGPTDPKRTGPFGGKTRIIRHQIDCQPCRERSCSKRTCMELITVDEVFAAVKQAMDNSFLQGVEGSRT